MNFLRSDAGATVGEDSADSQADELSVWSLGTAGAAESAQSTPATFGHMHLLARAATKGLRER